MENHDVFLYIELGEDGVRRDDVRWYSAKSDKPLRLAAVILARAAAGDIGLRTLCLGFGDDYEAMVPKRVTREPRGFGDGLTFQARKTDESNTEERDDDGDGD